MELEQLKNWGCFCHFLGTLRVTPVNRPKKALKVIRSFSKLACHHFIAKWRCPQNLKKIGEVMDFECTFSMERAIWDLKEQRKAHDICWSIAATAPAYNPNSKTCHLCLMEKTLILTSDHPYPLNKRTELLSKCRHRRKYLLSNLVT